MLQTTVLRDLQVQGGHRRIPDVHVRRHDGRRLQRLVPCVQGSFRYCRWDRLLSRCCMYFRPSMISSRGANVLIEHV